MAIDEEYYDLVLTKEGKIIQSVWEYDHDAGVGHYNKVDKTGDPYSVLYKTLRIEPGFTLKHLFDIVSEQSEIIDLAVESCWITNFISHYKGMIGDWEPEDYWYKPDGIEYLYLYWNAELDESVSSTYIWGVDRPSFDGQGWLLREDKYDEWGNLEYKKDTRINWGIDFSPLGNLLHLPLVANEDFNVGNDLKYWKPDQTNEERFALQCKRKYTLKNVIEGVFWELSFYGSPEDKEETSKMIKERHEEVNEAIKSGDMSKFVTVGSPKWDEFKKSIGLNVDDEGEVA